MPSLLVNPNSTDYGFSGSRHVLSFWEHHEVSLGPLLLPQAFVLGSQELDAEWGPFPQGLNLGALGHEERPQLREVCRAQAWAGSLHPDPGEKQTRWVGRQRGAAECGGGGRAKRGREESEGEG